MSNISIIVAVDRCGAIGRDGNQPFFISADLRRFRDLTMGHPIIMGRKTFQALPRGPLPGRTNIVVSRDAAFHPEGTVQATSVDAAINATANAAEAFVIGGAQIYAQFMPVASRLYLTEIDAEAEGADTFFPAINPAEWAETNCTEWATDPKSGLRYRYRTLRRI